MANVTLVADNAVAASIVSLKGTSGDDTITVDLGAANVVGTYDVNAAGGSDTVVFDRVLGLGTDTDAFYASGQNEFTYQTGGGVDSEAFDLSAVESIQFTNGTITSNASVTPETLMSGAINQDIATLAATAVFDTSSLLTWDGSSVTSSAGWTIESVNGQASAANALITVLDGTTVQGRVAVNGTNDGITVQAENAFHTALDIGEEGTISVDLVLTNGTDSFSQTVTVDVVGVPSDADNNFTASDTTAANIDLLGGDDRAFGGALGDFIFGEDGNDAIYAGANDAGNDTLIGGNDDDILAGGAGNDILVGDSAQSTNVNAGTVPTDEGTNQLFGGAGDDILVVGGFDDGNGATATLLYDTTNAVATDLDALGTAAVQAEATGTEGGQAYGGDGNDYIIGTASGDDVIGMGNGDDIVVVGSGDNTIYAGADDTGADTVFVEAGTTGDNEIYTGGGIDTVVVSNGDNTVGLGAGDDIFNNAAVTGNNEIFGGAGMDAITAGSGNDTIFGGDDNDTIITGNGNNVVDGGAGVDGITAGTGNDMISGGAGVDTIDAVNGTNTVTGGTGNDVITAGDGTDTFVFAEGDGSDSIDEFAVNVDKIDLSAVGTSFSGLVIQTFDLNGNGAADAGDYTVVSYGDAGDSITLVDFLDTVTALDGADFIF